MVLRVLALAGKKLEEAPPGQIKAEDGACLALGQTREGKSQLRSRPPLVLYVLLKLIAS